MTRRIALQWWWPLLLVVPAGIVIVLRGTEPAVALPPDSPGIR